MTQEELKAILDLHKKWKNHEKGGKRADLRRADLSGADLSGAYLSGAYLSGADLSWAYLSGADLSGAYLSGAYLRADLSGADLRRADLRRADLSWADLRRADLSGAYLSDETKIDDSAMRFFPLACPESGSFIGWKKTAEDLIVKLLIPEDAKRSSAFGRKCRCNKAVVLAIEELDGTPSKMKEARSKHNCLFVYRLGETVEVEDFDEDRKHECAPGIHFFITRGEAVDY